MQLCKQRSVVLFVFIGGMMDKTVVAHNLCHVNFSTILMSVISPCNDNKTTLHWLYVHQLQHVLWSMIYAFTTMFNT